MTARVGTFRTAPGLLGCLASLRGGQIHPRTPRLRKADGNRLLRRSRPVFPFTDVLYFLANEFTSLCRRRLSLGLCTQGTPLGQSFGHGSPGFQ